MNTLEPLAVQLLLAAAAGCLVVVLLLLKQARAAERSLSRSSERLSVLFDQSPVGVLVFDAQLRVTECNERMSEVLGVRTEEVMGLHCSAFGSSSLVAVCEAGLHGVTGGYDGPFETAPGKELWLQGRVSPLSCDGAPVGSVFAAWDVTGAKRTEALVDQLAFHDTLTGLPNRTLFRDRLRQALDEAERAETNVALALLDLDRFASVAEAVGHSAADGLLQQVASRMTALLRQCDTIARIGSHQLGFILPRVEGGHSSMAMAQRILAALRAPCETDGQCLSLTGSVGIAVYPGDAPDAYALIGSAERALRWAQELGGDQAQFHDVCTNLDAAERLSIEQGLRVALETDEFEVFFEPQLGLEDGVTHGVEALVRWRHPERGLLYPDAFIAVAEETGLITRIDLWVLGSACRIIAGCNAHGGDLRLAVNVSAHDLLAAEFLTGLRGVLAATGMNPSRLELELTETAMIDDVEASRRVLEEVRALGVGVVLDDFGTGYASLTHLRGLPVDRVKIDRSFVMRCEEDGDAASIVRALVGLAQNLGLGIVAEGIETPGQAEFLRALGCDEGQGHLFGRAVPAHASPALACWAETAVAWA